MAQTIEVKNIGPVDRVSIPVPDGGGVVVLRGRNGVGKTQALRAVESAVTGMGKPSVRDGAVRGEVQGLGVTVKIGRATRRSGELEVESLHGRLNVADLVDPGLKSPEAADARRIKMLVGLTGVEADASLFYPIFGGEAAFKEVVKATTLETDDIVLMAERIKRDCEELARQQESQADHLSRQAAAKVESAKGVPLDAESDPHVLQAALELAINDHASLETRRREADRMRSERLAAQNRLDELQCSYSGPSVDDACAHLKVCEGAVSQATDRVRELEMELLKARSDLQSAIGARDSASEAVKAAEHHEKLVAELMDVLGRDQLAPPSDAELLESSKRVDKVRKAVETGALVRQARIALDAASRLESEANSHLERAAYLREAGRSTDEVLSQIVSRAVSALRVEAGRLVMDTHRGTTYFSELSHGERWKVAIDVAIDAVGKNGLLVIDQEAWEGLDPVNRAEVVGHVRGSGVVILTAEASDSSRIVPEVVGG